MNDTVNFNTRSIHLIEQDVVIEDEGPVTFAEHSGRSGSPSHERHGCQQLTGFFELKPKLGSRRGALPGKISQNAIDLSGGPLS